jgi:8-oxo-dGTP pyrophosphatase MutT (NUDIX family)
VLGQATPRGREANDDTNRLALPPATLRHVPERQFRPNEVSAGGVVVRPSESRAYEVCLVSDGRYWGLPKGNVERAESPEETALREIAEETGLDVDGLVLIGSLPPSEYVYRRGGRLIFKRVHFFLVRTPAGSQLTPQPEEIAEACWLSFEEARARAGFRDTVTALDEAERILGAAAQ